MANQSQKPSTIAPIRVAKVDVFVWRAAVQEPVRNAFGSQTERATASLRLEASDGAHGWGDIWGNFPAPTPEYRARLAMHAVAPRLLGRQVEDVAAFWQTLTDECRLLALQSAEPGPFASIVAAVDAALWDLAARRAGQPLRQLLNPAAADSVRCYASGINPEGAAATVAAARRGGFGAFKLKIGFGREADLATVAEVRQALQPGEALMVDANQKWAPGEAMEMVAAFEDFGLEWLEEPMAVDAPAESWRALRRDGAPPLAGGENMRGLGAFEQANWLSVLQPDLGKWGGVSQAFAVGQGALAGGRRYCPHWLAGGIGLLASAQVLAAVGGDGRLEVDQNANPLRTQLVPASQRVVDGRFQLDDTPGIGAEPELDALSDALVLHLQQ